MDQDQGDWFSVAMGFLLGFAAAALVAHVGILGDAKDAVNVCEAELPRDQHCVIVAVPEEE